MVVSVCRRGFECHVCSMFGFGVFHEIIKIGDLYNMQASLRLPSRFCDISWAPTTQGRIIFLILKFKSQETFITFFIPCQLCRWGWDGVEMSLMTLRQRVLTRTPRNQHL